MPEKLYCIVCDQTGLVEFSSNSSAQVAAMFDEIPETLHQMFSLWEFVPCGSFDQVHLHMKGKKRHDHKR